MRLPWFKSAVEKAAAKLSPKACDLLAIAAEGGSPQCPVSKAETEAMAVIVRDFRDEVCASMEKLRGLVGMRLVAGEFHHAKDGPDVRFILAGKGMIFRIDPPEKSNERKEP